MKRIIAFLLLNVPFLAISQTNQLLIASHIKKLENAKKYTIDIASKLHEDQYGFKPVKSEMSFKEQLVHIGENIFWLSSNYIAENSNPLVTNKPNVIEMDKQKTLIFINDAYSYAISAIRELDTNTLDKEFQWNGGKLNKLQFLNLIQDHQTHHAGQLIVYLRLNHIEPPKYIGW